MKAFRRDRARKRLHDALAIAPDEPFLQMAWGLHALRIGRPDLARQVMEVPDKAVNQATGQPLAIHAWEVETLVNQLILTPKRSGRRSYHCRNFGTASEFTNYLRDLENAEYALKADPAQVLKEMHRIGQRQFPWQRRMPNLPDFYRPIFLYGQGGGAAAFEEANGLSVSQFVLIGFGLYAAFSSRPFLERHFDMTALGISSAHLEAALSLLSIPAGQAPGALRKTIQDAGASGAETAYRPSLLRRQPILAYGARGERLWAPLPDLILQRVTFGLYYDVIRPGGAQRNEISGRFEHYAADLVRGMMPGFVPEPAYTYRVSRGRQIDSPDVLLTRNGQLAAVIECKATKLTFAAQFSADPVIDAEARYAEIGKGVFQIWRFFAQCRLGRTRHQVTPETRGLLLTLDTWLTMGRDLQEHVREVASRLADADPEIVEEDRRPVLFVAAQDFEGLLSQTDEDGFLNTLDVAGEDRFLGWILPNIARELGPLKERKPYPFEPAELLPWWGERGAGVTVTGG